MSKSGLLPCPFCGSDAHIATLHKLHATKYQVYCTCCSVRTPSSLQVEEVYQTWNARFKPVVKEEKPLSAVKVIQVDPTNVYWDPRYSLVSHDDLLGTSDSIKLLAFDMYRTGNRVPIRVTRELDGRFNCRNGRRRVLAAKLLRQGFHYNLDGNSEYIRVADFTLNAVLVHDKMKPESNNKLPF